MMLTTIRKKNLSGELLRKRIRKRSRQDVLKENGIKKVSKKYGIIFFYHVTL